MTTLPEPVTRAAILECYRPIRASIQAILAVAVGSCKKADFHRAAKHLGLMDELQLEDDDNAAMLCDIALFEPNQRGRRIYDGFLARGVEALDPPDRAVAQRLGAAFFSLFHVAGWHEAGGVWVEDLLDGDRRLWLMDAGLEASATEGMTIGLRVFDAGPFHAGLGLIVNPDPEMTKLCIQAAARGNRYPVRHSLAATFYGDAILDATVPVMLGSMMDDVGEMSASERREALKGLDALVDPDSPADAELRDVLTLLVTSAPLPAARRRNRRG